MQAAEQRKPREFYTQRACKCAKCGNHIYGHNLAAKANGQTVCIHCAERATYDAASQKFKFK